jgi:hypothetical protein
VISKVEDEEEDEDDRSDDDLSSSVSLDDFSDDETTSSDSTLFSDSPPASTTSSDNHSSISSKTPSSSSSCSSTTTSSSFSSSSYSSSPYASSSDEQPPQPSTAQTRYVPGERMTRWLQDCSPAFRFGPAPQKREPPPSPPRPPPPRKTWFPRLYDSQREFDRADWKLLREHYVGKEEDCKCSERERHLVVMTVEQLQRTYKPQHLRHMLRVFHPDKNDSIRCKKICSILFKKLFYVYKKSTARSAAH